VAHVQYRKACIRKATTVIESTIKSLMREQHIPGLAVAILQGNKRIYEGYHGVANIEARSKVTPETRFEIASLTKMFTAQVILRLVQEEHLHLDDSLVLYLPDLPDHWQPVTIRHCLSHQSGIRSYTAIDDYWTQTKHDKTHAEVINFVRELPLDFTPGHKHAYDNTGYYILGMLIERITERSFADILQAIIFDPLEMRTARANNYQKVIPHRASGYEFKEGTYHNKPYYSPSNTFSAGCVIATLRDLMRWRLSLFDERILTDYHRHRLWIPQPSIEANERQFGFEMGLGMFIVDHPRGKFIGHNGAIQGFVASFLHFPENELSAMVLCNAGHIQEPHAIAFSVIDALERDPFSEYTPEA